MSWSPTTAPHGDFETVYLVMAMAVCGWVGWRRDGFFFLPFVVIGVALVVDVALNDIFGSPRLLGRWTVVLIVGPALAYIVGLGARALFVLLRGQAEQIIRGVISLARRYRS
jgi:hypothetical protein